VFKLLDCAGQGRLADIALFSRTREIQCVGKRNEIAHLLHFHRNGPFPKAHPLTPAGRNGTIPNAYRTDAASDCDPATRFRDHEDPKTS
jgi:hypothetical protein